MTYIKEIEESILDALVENEKDGYHRLHLESIQEHPYVRDMDPDLVRTVLSRMENKGLVESDMVLDEYWLPGSNLSAPLTESIFGPGFEAYSGSDEPGKASSGTTGSTIYQEWEDSFYRSGSPSSLGATGRSTLYERARRLFEEEDEDEDEDDEFELDFGDDLGDELGDLGDEMGDEPEEEPEEEPEDEPEEEPEEEPPSPEEIQQQIGSDAIGDAIGDAIERALNVSAESAISESLTTGNADFGPIFEDEPLTTKAPQIDVVVYAKEIANLIQNYTTLLDVPKMIYDRSVNYLQENFGDEWVEAFEEAMNQLNVSVELGGDGRGPLTTGEFSPDGVESGSGQNPMTGNLSVGASGEGGGGGGL